MNELVIGIDGGGTRTRARLADLEGRLLGAGEAGSANPASHGASAAQNEILTAIERAFGDARIEKQIATAVCLGIGGIERAPERGAFTQWAEQNIASRAEVLNDAQIVIAAGTPEGWGIALISGTGTMAWGRAPDGRMARASGWGYWLGDEGSSFDLAREALRAATQYADGRSEKTKLLPAILEFWNLREPLDLMPRVYRTETKPADIAQLAPLVIREAERGDSVAFKLVEHAGQALAQAVLSVARALKFENAQIPLALTGGLLLGSELMQKQLQNSIRASDYIFAPIELVHHPVTGAVRLAIQLAKA